LRCNTVWFGSNSPIVSLLDEVNVGWGTSTAANLKFETMLVIFYYTAWRNLVTFVEPTQLTGMLPTMQRVGCTVAPHVNGQSTNRRIIPGGSSIPHRYTRVSTKPKLAIRGNVQLQEVSCVIRECELSSWQWNHNLG